MRNVWEKATADYFKISFPHFNEETERKKHIKTRQPVSAEKYHPEITRNQQVLTATL
jgi:hypothetical protein